MDTLPGMLETKKITDYFLPHFLLLESFTRTEQVHRNTCIGEEVPLHLTGSMDVVVAVGVMMRRSSSGIDTTGRTPLCNGSH